MIYKILVLVYWSLFCLKKYFRELIIFILLEMLNGCKIKGMWIILFIWDIICDIDIFILFVCI